MADVLSALELAILLRLRWNGRQEKAVVDGVLFQTRVFGLSTRNFVSETVVTDSRILVWQALTFAP